MAEKDYYEMLWEEREADSVDEHYFLEGVELAEGWERVDSYQVRINGVGHWFNAQTPDYVKDALAAQLVRQVDALETPHTVEMVHGAVWVGYRSQSAETFRKTKGPDRTMNTILAIVDSGVLADQGGQPK